MKLPRITYHSDVQPLPGSYIVPQGPRARRAYLVLTSREVKARQPRKNKVWALEVERLGQAAVPADAVTHPIYWFSRDRKPRPGQRRGA
ncbi:hypothetical protein TSH58p_17510 [Azospirillum sp. TSH58]|uniref:hypothetical protein n=1 Tax=Azospirillum sp. TSH58 TaxID=664962 RepID=UPI000D6004DB|nr:hypothetical protein [Azospirillum sp. TSH58]AWJ85162.1 hypothetical protein TSH58p_17510 [Azospirillum sp. TSH58]PWC80836.1 hypothetical protein TSH58_00915 [Azospirillum sp. TSH58]